MSVSSAGLQTPFLRVLCLFIASLSTASGSAQVVINEIIADNTDRPPADIGESHPDMVEIYNASDTLLDLEGFALSDTPHFCAFDSWVFPAGRSTVPPKGYLVVFCDENEEQGDCELHASFRIASDGSEPLSLWSGADAQTGDRTLVDQVWLPPLPSNHSFGRVPDGSGPAPVPVEETFDVFRIHAPENTTFGACTSLSASCSPDGGETTASRRLCSGSANKAGDNLKPRIERESHSAVAPSVDEAVHFVVRVEDEGDPSPGNIATVQIRYAVNGVAQEPVDMTYDSATGVVTGAKQEQVTSVLCGTFTDFGRPLLRWTFWEGSIPGLPAGSRVDFEFYVEDAGGLSDASPGDRCPESVGPCNSVGLPGPGCVLEADCTPTEFRGCSFESCDLRRQYLVGYQPPAVLAGLAINEVVASQDRILKDPSQDCSVAQDDPDEADATCGFEDFIELSNKTAEPIDLSGLWLSNRPFHPQGWQFPAGSVIEAGEYLIVWTDNDGGKCPRPAEDLPGDGQECPDPTSPAEKSYHTDFNLDGAGDQIFLFAGSAGGFGVVHGFAYDETLRNFSWSLNPDGVRTGSFSLVSQGTPGAPNGGGGGETFVRGDTSDDCAVDLADAILLLNRLFLDDTIEIVCPDAADSDDDGQLRLGDAIYSLNWQFLGGPILPAPGPNGAGIDLTEDGLGPCGSTCQ